MHHMNPEMEQCIQNCLNCHHVCYETALNHCLETGGKHTEPQHFRLMMNCAEICQTSANFMLSGSELHKLQRFALALATQNSAGTVLLYAVRLVASLLILAAIIDKNRTSQRRNSIPK